MLVISDQALRSWVKQDQHDRRERGDGPASAEREEFRELRRRMKRLEVERHLLKRDAAFFAKDTEIR